MASIRLAWQLVYGGNVLGTLTYRTVDQPFFHCHFSPTADFAEVAHLYAAELKSLDAGLMERWERDYEKILALGLKLVPVDPDTSPPIEEFLLHIDGDTAWFRC
jgi:hypothetical protein